MITVNYVQLYTFIWRLLNEISRETKMTKECRCLIAPVHTAKHTFAFGFMYPFRMISTEQAIQIYNLRAI